MPEKINLSTNLVNAVLQYLGSQPYVNVAQLIEAVRAEASPQMPQNEAPAELEEAA